MLPPDCRRIAAALPPAARTIDDRIPVTALSHESPNKA
jgi:hypothetical protein